MNTFQFDVDDETKTLTAGETLVSGSRYSVVFTNGTARIGSRTEGGKTLTGELVLSVPGEGCARVVVARCSLAADTAVPANAVGEINLATAELQGIANRMPEGGEIELDALVHSDCFGEHVGLGRLRVKCSRFSTDETTGASTLYRGQKGDAGVGVASVVASHTDAQGNLVVKVALTDGSAYYIAVPRGNDGKSAKMTAAYYPQVSGDGTWHAVSLETNSDGEKVLVVDQSPLDLDDVPESEVSASQAANSAKQAKAYAEGETTGGEVTTKGAKQYAEDAAESAEDAEESAGEAAASATAAAASAAQAATAGAEAGATAGATAGSTAGANAASPYVQQAKAQADAAKASAEEAEQKRSAASGFADTALGHANSASASASAAAASAASVDADTLVHKDQEETITGKKTFGDVAIAEAGDGEDGHVVDLTNAGIVKVPTAGDDSDDSSAASTEWVNDRLDTIFRKMPVYIANEAPLSTAQATALAARNYRHTIVKLVVRRYSNAAATLKIKRGSSGTWTVVSDIDSAAGSKKVFTWEMRSEAVNANPGDDANANCHVYLQSSVANVFGFSCVAYDADIDL